MDESEIPLELFHDVVLTIIPSEDLSQYQAAGLVEVVEHNGGRYVPLRSDDQRIENLTDLTHIISTHIDFPQYNTALDHGIHTVKPSWIITSANKMKQAQPRQHSPDPSQFFHDVVLTTADLPESDKEAIIAGVWALGGQHSGVLSKLVTHIVANDLNNNKCAVAMDKGSAAKIVIPKWFDDCFTLGRMINEKPYLLPDPEILRSENGRVRDIPSVHLQGAIVASPTGVPQSTPPPSPADVRKNLNAFMCKKILLSKDLELSDHILQTLRNLIEYGGATLTDRVEDCDIYVGYYRDGDDYVQASRANKEVANLSWLYHVINRNVYTSPLAKLLHYPIPRNGVPGFENLRISISNYTGDARIYLENLIRYCGAEFTKTMKQDNTHLITAHTQSEKCEAAQEWNINIVNHIWLEESYAKCAVQTLSNQRYTCFPARTNLGEVTGQTRLDMKKLEPIFFQKPRASPQKQTQPADAAVKSKPGPRKTVPSTSTIRASATTNHSDPILVAGEWEDEQPQTTKKARGRPPKSTSTPRFGEDEKENASPMLRSSDRASKHKALNSLAAQAEDIALFQKEQKRKGGVTHGGRRSSLAEDFSSPVPGAAKQRKKRTSDESNYDVTAEGSDLSDGETQDPSAKPAKRVKSAPAPSGLPPVQYRMMVTGDERWINNAKQEGTDKTKLRQLGVMLTMDPTNVNILVAPKFLRTRKFVCALAAAPLVVETKYLDTALKENRLMPDPPLLSDVEAEERMGFTLASALERAKLNARKLFRGWSVFVTKDVNGGFDTYKDIITRNGGDAWLYAGRRGLSLPKRRLRPEDDPDAGEESQHQGGEEEFDYVYLISGTSEPEVKLWKPFRDLAAKQGLQARVVKSDWLLNAAMSQTIEWREEWELREADVMSLRNG